MEDGKRPSPYSFQPLTGCKVVAYAMAVTVGHVQRIAVSDPGVCVGLRRFDMDGCHALLFQLKQFSQERIPKKTVQAERL